MAPGIQRLCFATLTASSALAMAACGSSSNSREPSAVVKADNGEAAKPGPEVLKDAVAAMTATGAVHITMVGTQGKPAQPVTEDGHVQSDGVMGSAKSAAGEEDFILIGKTLYVKGFGADPSGTTLPASLKKYANRWVKFSGDSSGDSGDSSLSVSSTNDEPTLAGFGKSLSHPDSGVTINAKVTKGSLNGHPVVSVTESDGSSFTVARSGPPYVLKAVMAATKNNGDESGTLIFSDYGKRVVIQAPPDALDISSLLPQIASGVLPSTLPSGFPTAAPTG